jgi:hypothetical protein
MTTDTAPTLEEVLEDLSRLGHPLRVRILLELDRAGDASPNELAGERITEEEARVRRARGARGKAGTAHPRGLGATLGIIAYHVRVLALARYITLASETRVRGAVEHHYRITPAGRGAIAATKRLLDEAPA